jgi:hypothetical protein
MLRLTSQNTHGKQPARPESEDPNQHREEWNAATDLGS